MSIFYIQMPSFGAFFDIQNGNFPECHSQTFLQEPQAWLNQAQPVFKQNLPLPLRCLVYN